MERGFKKKLMVWVPKSHIAAATEMGLLHQTADGRLYGAGDILSQAIQEEVRRRKRRMP